MEVRLYIGLARAKSKASVYVFKVTADNGL